VGRYGGEEFILLLPGVRPEVASEIAAEISRRLERRTSATVPRLPTVSYGIAATSHGRAELSKMVAAADAALYQAKSLGRDRSVLASHLEEKTA
jgi:diguanylate cyclase (GGDEF)-like protein